MKLLLVIWIFQFHKGTIKTGTAANIAATIDRFQFHKGTIKTIFAYAYRRTYCISIP